MNMNLNISGQRMDLTDALRNYVTEKIKRVERHFDHVIDADVVLTVEKKLRRRADATVKLSGRTLHAGAENEDMYAAIDAMVDKLDRQTCKFKEKLKDHGKAKAARS